jgi:hypothetical protein
MVTAVDDRSRRARMARRDEGASLEIRKIYRVRVDTRAERIGLLRVFDESGESYLYPKARFGGVNLAPRVAKALRGSAIDPANR